MDIILIALVILIIVLAGLTISMYFHWGRTHRKINELLEKGNIKDFKDILLSQKEKHSNLEAQLKEAFKKIEQLEQISERTIQKIGIIRFNPFSDMGGNQSFVIAMLDDHNNGFVLSSLFVKEGNRVYAKSVKAGKSEHTLSQEELKALDKAINS